jgi:hypothetical protein
MKRQSMRLWLLVCVVVALFSVPALAPAGEKGFKVHGYVMTSPSAPASGISVVLIDRQTGAVVDSSTTGFLGGYKFKDVAPGMYVLKVEKFTREVVVVKKNVRMDFNLSEPGGIHNPWKATLESLASSGGGGGGGPAASVGPSAPGLMQAMAGEYYSYAGSTERKVTLCANGTFFSASESSYSGTSSDSLGNQTGAWGAAGQNQSGGNWSVQGSQQGGTITLGYRGGKTEQVRYESTGERGCFRFNGNPFCYSGAGACR